MDNKIKTVEILHCVFNGENSDRTRIIAPDLTSFRLVGFVCNSAEITTANAKLNDDLFEAAVQLLSCVEKGLYTGHAASDLQSVIDRMTGKTQQNDTGNLNGY